MSSSWRGLILWLFQISAAGAFLAPQNRDASLRFAGTQCISNHHESDSRLWQTSSSPIEKRDLHCGLLFSSFSDGLKPNSKARRFLARGLVQAMLQEQLTSVEHALAQSAIQSPCCGPNTDLLAKLQMLDDKLNSIWSRDNDDENASGALDLLLSSLVAQQLRFVYIPTAMYALRPESNNTPGKQRQRARADGKKRRNEIVRLLQQELSPQISISVVTLDLDDGSIKQPEGFGEEKHPIDGIEALATWKPHLVYVEGGNTFWLHHCLEKGGYLELLTNLISSSSSPSDQKDVETVYCGSSAGAIAVGQTVETACWKGWDDPRVVPGRSSPEKWCGVSGLNLVQGRSFFPHMEAAIWTRLVEEKRQSLTDSGLLVCLEENEVFCVRQRSEKPVSYFAVLPSEPSVGALENQRQ